MKRSGEIKRKTPLKRTPIKRKPTQRGDARKEVPTQVSTRGVWSKSKKSGKSIPAGVRHQVEERSGGMCEARVANDCGTFANHQHHIKPRGRGGPDEVDNLLHVCGGPFGGDGGCHTWIHAHPIEAKERGWLQ